MKIILRPNDKDNQYGQLKNLSAIEPPLWAAIFANYYKVDKLIDAEALNLSFTEIIEEVARLNPTELIIFPNGSHPSAHIQQLGISKELEKYFKEICKTTIIESLPVSPCGWGKPRWDMLPMNKYRAHNWHCWGGLDRNNYGVLYTSIGCPYSCSFCTIKSWYGQTYQSRTLEDIFQDIDDLAKLNIVNIKIMDELFILNKKKVFAICDYIIEKGYKFNIWCYARIDTIDSEILAKMKKAGINWVSYGIESGNDEIRKNILKGNFNKDKVREVINITRDNGVYSLGNYMFGFWEDTLDTMKETLDFAIELNCEYANFYCTVAYPKSKLYDEMKEKGVKLPTRYMEYAQCSKYFNPLPTKVLTSKEVLNFRDEAFYRYFTNEIYLNNIEKTFGVSTVEEIKDMLNIKIKREYNNGF